MTRKSKAMKLLSVLLAFVMVLGVVPFGMFTASAATEGVLMYSLSNGEATIIGCDTEATGEVVIPEKLGECPVTAISLYSFAECESITGVTIPDSVKTIGHYAFSDCTALADIKIGSGVESIGSNAFANCTSLEKVEVSADNAVYTSDETGVLYNKEKTELLLYPAANAATIYTVAENVKTIADNTFTASKNVKTIVMGDNVTAIGANAFMGSRSLETVVIGKGVKTIGTDAFEGCAKLTGISVGTDNATFCSDENGVLYSKDKTQLIKYPAGNARTAFSIPAGVKTISVLSFSNATNLTTLAISKDVTEIAASAFYGCTAIAEVTYEGSETEWKAITIGANNEALTNAKITYAGGIEHGHSYTSSVTTEATCTEKGVLIYKCECGHSYTEAIPAKGHSFKNNVCSACQTKEFVFTTDGTNAKITAYNGKAISLVIPATVEGYTVNAIGDSAFENCDKIISVTIPESVKDIGSCAFYKTGYYNNTANWEKGVLYIGSFLIEANESVKGAVEVKDATTLIADYAFASRSGITSVILPKELAVIGDSSFSGCTAIKNVTSGATEDEWKSVVIGTGNENLINAKFTFAEIPHTHVYVVEEVLPTCIEAGYKVSTCECGDIQREDYDALGHNFVNNVCSRCKEREYEISIVNNEVTILGCHTSLSGEITLPDVISGYAVTAIGEKAFADNEKIENIIIPASVTSIGDMAFAGSKIAVEVSSENPNYLTENGILYNKTKSALLYCSANKAGEKLEIPVGVTVIGVGAFYGASAVQSVKIPDSVVSIDKDAFAGCTGIKSVIYDGTKTQWGKINIGEGNEALANITYLDVSDVELATALASDLKLTGATAKAEEIIIVITADKDVNTIEINKKTVSDKSIVLKTEGASITESEDKYVLLFDDWHKAGNKTETEITVDGDTYTVKFVFPIENDGHDYSIVEKIEVSCAVQGSTRYTCAICGDYYDEDIVEKLGHTYGNWVIDVDETCTENGVKYRECSVCNKDTEGHIETGVVLATGHKYNETVTAPTCTVGGYTTYYCSACGDSYDGNNVPATGHAYGEWTVTTPAGCETAGERTRECTVCDETVAAHTETEEIAATGHSYVPTVTAPTYTSQGYTTYDCENCDSSYISDYVNALSKLVSVSIENIVMKKDEQWGLNPVIEAYGPVKYTVTYEVADSSIATVDEKGVVTGITRGTTQIICTVTDENGNSVSDICSVEVKFTILQWITWVFVDLLFGFIKDFIPQQ